MEVLIMHHDEALSKVLDASMMPDFALNLFSFSPVDEAIWTLLQLPQLQKLVNF